MKTSEKIVNYNKTKVQNQLLKVLRKNKRESTVADLIASTGLPSFQVETEIQRIAFEFNGQMKVTESGEILYTFPDGLRNQVKGFRPKLKKIAQKVLSALATAGKFLFKISIMVMLVGYFVLFLAIMVLAILASIFSSVNSRSSNRNGFGGFVLISRIINLFIRIWFYSSLTRSMSGQSSIFGNSNNRNSSFFQQQRNTDEKKYPLYKAIFDFVFGNGDPNENKDSEIKKVLAAEIQRKKGILTLEETMATTGLSPQNAEHLLSSSLLEWNGFPEASKEGTILYRFPELIKTQTISDKTLSPWKAIPANNNPEKLNRIIMGINTVNIAMGGYFFFYTTFAGKEALASSFSGLFRFVYQLLMPFIEYPAGIIQVSLGMVPLAFSFLFFLIPSLRKNLNKKKNRKNYEKNFQKKIYKQIVENPKEINESALIPDQAEQKDWIDFREKTLVSAAAALEGDPETSGNGTFVYHFPSVDRHLKDAGMQRQKVEYIGPGKTIFDTSE